MPEHVAISLTWTEVGAVLAGLAVLTAFIVAGLRSIFLTESKHDMICRAVQSRTCTKLDDINKKLAVMEERREAAKEIQRSRDIWLGQTLQRVADKLEVKIGEMP